MDKTNRRNVEIRQFPGISTEVDAHDVPEGVSPRAVNCDSSEAGVLQNRKGFREVQFEN